MTNRVSNEEGMCRAAPTQSRRIHFTDAAVPGQIPPCMEDVPCAARAGGGGCRERGGGAPSWARARPSQSPAAASARTRRSRLSPARRARAPGQAPAAVSLTGEGESGLRRLLKMARSARQHMQRWRSEAQ